MIQVKQNYDLREQDILTNFDFKEAYGANNEKVRRNHIKKELSDIVEQRNSLEISINYLKRKIDFLRELVRVKNTQGAGE